ncbi:alpha/beta hydrolase [Actinoplanes friuliensis]|uniref:Esterase n=1 Tax=Actinoplanes friuliensis DSM 7358 TaxID=1246995 RepID=U5VV87_9ACTN|nr:alpha/beta hydrolase [Actinoplanes friuliensis]AGZ40923.1 esterase [Actinoplanes friuliensis DSM 7358]
MELAEAVAAFLATKPDSGDPGAPVAVRRTAIHHGSDQLFDMFGAAVAPVGVTDHVLDRPGGGIRVRVYRPATTRALPLYVFLHGGGFWLGSVEEKVNEALCHDRSGRAQCVVVAVDYRLAPEHPFPVPLEDCFAGLSWAVEHAAELGADPERVAIGGISAGATLAAAVTLLARTRGGPRIDLQLLEVPPLDLTLDTMVSSGIGDDYGITVDDMRLCADLYLGAGPDRRDPLVSPLHAADLTGLPPARIQSAEHDPLRLDGERYAQRLREAGVPVSFAVYPGAVHGSLALTGAWPPAATWHQDIVDALSRLRTSA